MQNKKSNVLLDKKSINNGCFEGYASVFNEVDHDGDVILPGAFKESLARKVDIKLLWQHYIDKPIGILQQVFEDTKGLYVKAELSLSVRKACECYELMKLGAVDSMSIGYKVDDFFYANGLRYIKRLTLFEISLVTFPANDKAKITEIKALGDMILLKNQISRALSISKKLI